LAKTKTETKHLPIQAEFCPMCQPNIQSDSGGIFCRNRTEAEY